MRFAFVLTPPGEGEKKGTKFSFQDNAGWCWEEVPWQPDSSCCPPIPKRVIICYLIWICWWPGSGHAHRNDHATFQELHNLFAPVFNTFTPSPGMQMVHTWKWIPTRNLVAILDLSIALQGWQLFCHGLVLKVMCGYNQYCLELLALPWVIGCILVDVAEILSNMTINMQNLKMGSDDKIGL